MLHRLRSARAGVAKAPAARAKARQRLLAASMRGSEIPWVSRRAAYGPARTIGSACPRDALADEENSAIIDVGSRGSGNDEVAQGLEKASRIVLGEKRRRIKTLPDRPMQAGRVDQGPGRVARIPSAAIGAVGVSGNRRD